MNEADARIAGGAVLGAVAMYLLDPEAGERDVGARAVVDGVDAAISLCQGAFGLGGPPVSDDPQNLAADAAVLAGIRSALRPGGRLVVIGPYGRDDVSALLCDVPFLSDFRRASELATRAPYDELTGYLAVHRDQTDRVFQAVRSTDGNPIELRQWYRHGA